MTDVRTLELASNAPQETERIARVIGGNLKGGEVIELASDLGGGKTTFVRGLAEGAGSRDIVTSPTFSIGKVYTADNGLEIHHFDFYRLDEPGIMRQELAEVVGDKQAVVVIEWSDIMQDVLPADRLTIRFQLVADDEQARVLTISYAESLAYAVEGLQ